MGRAVVSEGFRRGWEVATFNRGHVPSTDPGVRPIIGDRLDRSTLERLCTHDWDVCVDTWSGAPRAVLDSTTVLSDHAARYVYISSGSVYAPPLPLGVQETAPTVTSNPAAEKGDYPELKRGAELAVMQSFGERGLLARAGLILGPHEDVGRLTWWLTRMAAGGEVLAPGPPDLQIQLIDARDLAAFVLDAALANHAGPFNVVSRRGHAAVTPRCARCLRAAKPSLAAPIRDSRGLIPPRSRRPALRHGPSCRFGCRPTASPSACTLPTSSRLTPQAFAAGHSNRPCRTPGSGSRRSTVPHPCGSTSIHRDSTAHGNALHSMPGTPRPKRTRHSARGLNVNPRLLQP